MPLALCAFLFIGALAALVGLMPDFDGFDLQGDDTENGPLES